jgi:hypothetical protein
MNKNTEKRIEFRHTSSGNLYAAILFMNDYFCFMKNLLLLLLITVIFATKATSQATLRVLFLGNSYTAVNDLPGMVSSVALSAGDTLIYDSNSPGGYTLQGHSTDAGSLNKIAAGGWDFVVLQEQSQLPSFPIGQVQTEVFPYARKLDSLILLSNPCAETVFYMTWGRKNGDASNCASWPPVCTYEGMDSLLRMRYMMMADDNDAIVSPAGAVWRYIRTKYPQIGLYDMDESHPSVEGTYATACSFYTVMFGKDPQQITFSGTLATNDADLIRTAVKAVVYDSLPFWFVGTYEPKAHFSFSQLQDTVSFSNQSLHTSWYLWDFGDGTGDTAANPVHIYTQNGLYTVVLKTGHCGQEDTATSQIQVVSIGLIPHIQPVLKLFPNPASDMITMQWPEGVAGKASSLLIYAPNGQMIRRENIPEGVLQYSFFVSSLPAGLWMVSVVGDHIIPHRGLFIRKP